ncbi:MAG: hypothetical protein ACPGSD_08515 [Flavobacteriales bacterium]
MIINKFNTVGIVSDADKLKLAAILFDSIIPVGKEHNVPENLISKIPIDYSVVEKVIEDDKKNIVKEIQGSYLTEYFLNISKNKMLPKLKEQKL